MFLQKPTFDNAEKYIKTNETPKACLIINSWNMRKLIKNKGKIKLAFFRYSFKKKKAQNMKTKAYT